MRNRDNICKGKKCTEKCNTTESTGRRQFMKLLKNQVEDFVFDLRAKNEPVEFIV